jgi:transposase
MEIREMKGLEIATNSNLTRCRRNIWLVPSQHRAKTYTVKFNPKRPTCTCYDFGSRGKKCKHIFAVEFTIRRAQGKRTPKAPKCVKPTYRQEWPAYHRAQVNEKAKFQHLLHELCGGLEEPLQKLGRPRTPLADVAFSAAFRVYSTMSARRFASDLQEAYGKGHISTLPSYNTIFDYFKMESLTAYLRYLIGQSSLPLKGVECDFALDSSGFSTCRFVRWSDVKYGNTEDWRDWIKVHLMCGVKTNIVTSVEVSGRYSNDSPFLKPLLESTAQSGFQIREVSADKGYDSFNNRCLVLLKGGDPYIPFREWEQGANFSFKGELWKRMYHYYKFHEEEFNAHYHKRSNAESTFSMIKAKFGERLRSKTATAQINEALCKVLCHNICCVIQSTYELGVEPVFWEDSYVKNE